MKKYLFILFILLAIRGQSVWAQEASYDRYAPLLSSNSETSPAWKKHFLVYPFELIRRPVDRTLIFVEDYHIKDKATWVYDQIKDYGVTPKFLKGASVRDGFGGGVNIDFSKLSRLGRISPDLRIEGSALWTTDAISDYRIKIMQKQIAGTGLKAGGNLRYENRGDENFYGIGPRTSLGDSNSYQMERTSLEAVLGDEFLNTWDLQGKFTFQNVNITSGTDGSKGIIDQTFIQTARQAIPGLAGDELLSEVLELKHDNRDQHDLPSRGGIEQIHFSFNKGIESNSGYFKYRGEVAHFFNLFSDRRVIGLRAVVEHSDELKGRDVPFFAMSRLGGYGTFPRYGDTNRGYRRDRFYDRSLMLLNAEYRWTILEYRDWRVDSVLFSDVGQVFGRWRDFKFNDFRPSYGVGFRVSFEKSILLTVAAARSEEGTELYVNTKAPF